MSRRRRTAVLPAALVVVAMAVIGVRAGAARLPADQGTPLTIAQAGESGDQANVSFSIRATTAFPDSAADFRILIDTDGDAVADTWVVVDYDASQGAVRAEVGPAGSAHLSAVTVARPDAATLTVSVPRWFLGGATGFAWSAAALSPGPGGRPDVVETAPGLPSLASPAPVRVAGSDRVETAVLSSFFTDGGARSVVLARSDQYADSLSGAALAAAKDGPLLLTPTAALDPRTLAEIRRCLPEGGTVYLLGGTDALSTAVEGAVRDAGYATSRLGGADRFATSLAVLEQGLGSVSDVLLATGHGFADALPAGAAAGAVGGAVLLTDGGVLPPAVSSWLSSHPAAVYAVGGPAAAADPQAVPLVGADRYQTAADVARAFFDRPVALGVASGLDWPDALAGGASMGRGHGPLLLTDPRQLPAPTAGYVSSDPGATAFLFGGPAAVGPAAAAGLNAAVTS